MTRHPWPGAYQTPGSMPSQPPSWWHEILMLLGRLDERSEHQSERLERIEGRLETGQAKFGEHEQRIDRLEQSVKCKPRVPKLERDLKRWAIVLIPLLSLLDTRLFEAALKVLEAVLR